MKGLYVYGALLMALSFAAGVVCGFPAVCAAAIASCASAALSEVIDELILNGMRSGNYAPRIVEQAQVVIAMLSWLLTGATALFAILSFI